MQLVLLLALAQHHPISIYGPGLSCGDATTLFASVESGGCYGDPDYSVEYTCTDAAFAAKYYSTSDCTGNFSSVVVESQQERCFRLLTRYYRYECETTPCFSRDTLACAVTDDDADAAYRAYYGGERGSAQLVPFSSLVAGDRVLTSDPDTQAPAITRVIVNQHRRVVSEARAAVRVEYSHGGVVVTPDHVVWADGGWKSARDVRSGSRVRVGMTEARVDAATATHVQGIVNPLTTAGTILALAPGGKLPMLASTFGDWIGHSMLSDAPLYPLAHSLSSAVSKLAPSRVQEFYDDYLEDAFTSHSPWLQAIAKNPIAAPAVALVADVGMSVALFTKIVLEAAHEGDW